MKAIIIYSSKGGVGKTTTTANIARLLAEQGKRVFIIDADINTPSMNTEFDSEHPHDNIWVHSSGNMFSDFIYLEKAMIRKYLEDAKKKLSSMAPDYVLVDTPPSVTNVHIEILKRLKVSYVLFVTQPTKLSTQDVVRTMDFFRKQCSGLAQCGIVENMCYDTDVREYPIPVIAQIPMQDQMDTSNLLKNAKSEFQKILDALEKSENVILEEYSTTNGYDETFDIRCFNCNKKNYTVECELTYDDGTGKTLYLKQPKFLSLRSWDAMREFIYDWSEQMPNTHFDQRISNCDTERIKRMLDAFNGDENAYFMVTNAPNTAIQLIPGEIGLCSLLIGEKGYFEIPRISYTTSKGSVVLFPDEIMPADMDLIHSMLQDDYHLLSDGRYMPPKETVQEMADTFGARIGLLNGWEEIYDEWLNT